jgi:hypothetical protein
MTDHHGPCALFYIVTLGSDVGAHPNCRSCSRSVFSEVAQIEIDSTEPKERGNGTLFLSLGLLASDFFMYLPDKLILLRIKIIFLLVLGRSPLLLTCFKACLSKELSQSVLDQCSSSMASRHRGVGLSAK